MFMRSFYLPLFLSLGNPEEETRPVNRLMSLLKENGYHIFDVDPSRQTRDRDNDIIAVRPKDPSSPVWIYQRRDGTFIVRPFINPSAYGQLMNSLSCMNLGDISLVQGGTLPLQEDESALVQWLPDEGSRERARELECL